MSKWYIYVLGVFFLVFGGCSSLLEKKDPSFLDRSGDYKPGELIVKYRSGMEGHSVSASLSFDTQVTYQKGLLEMVSFQGISVSEAMVEIEKDPRVDFAEPNYKVSLHDFSSSFLQDISIDNWGVDSSRYHLSLTPQGGASVVVAVIDSGIDITHPALQSRIWTNPNEIAGNGIDDDDNGYIDDIHGWDFSNGDSSVYDDPVADYHGTHVAGIIAQVTSGNVKIMSLKFVGRKGAYVSHAIQAIDYAVSQGVRISNNSWGTYSVSKSLKYALEESFIKGHVGVASAGNNGVDNTQQPMFPASYALDGLVSVGALQSNHSVHYRSNYGENVDVVSPGISIYSTLPDDKRGYRSGTSMAAPFVTGALALLAGAQPEASLSELKQVLLENTIADPSLSHKVKEGRRLDFPSIMTAVSSGFSILLPPGALTVRTLIANQVTLSWDPVLDSRVVGYDIYRITLNTNYALSFVQEVRYKHIGSVGASASSYVNTGLISGKELGYIVKARMADGTVSVGSDLVILTVL